MKISTVIPAYNEEKTIGDVLSVVTSYSEIDEVIVVNDGSTDNTSEAVSKYPIKLINLAENLGKGGAMKIGVDNAKGDIIVFLDADLIGFTVNHLEKMLLPVISGEAQMSIGIFSNGRLATDLAQLFSPYLSGQRVVRRQLIDGINNMELTRFGIEVALTRYARINKIPYQNVELENMSHVMKEEKLGFIKGFRYRLQMYWEILKVLPKRNSLLK
ncbi:MAG: glycosyltransferase family 2 protein [Halanaerobiales bacterium]|nr:glycosyltransferase family 2 protein [Halanaerobiales bacterium]